jgi:alanine dehydrogenase
VLILSARDVEQLLDLDQLVDAVEAAMIDLSDGRASMPPRVAASVAERDGLLLAMSAYLPSAGALTTKLVSLFPRNRDQPTHQALICCFDPDHGTPLAVMDGTYVTAVRTAAGSAMATRLLASRTQVVAVIGTGVQARAHARAIARLPGVEVLLVAGRDQDEAAALVAELVAAGLTAQEAGSIEAAVRAADVVCACTHADRPVVRRGWLRAGTHVNSVGYNANGDGEVDVETLQDAILVVESRAAALAPPPGGAIELRRAIEQGAIDAADVHAELGELAAGRAAGRGDPDQLTLYKSVGVAVQDAAAAAVVLRLARAQGIGTEVPI